MLESEMQLTKPPSVSSPQPISSLNTLELENCSQLQLYRVKSPEVTNEVCTSPNSTETIVQVARSNSANSQADEDNKTLTGKWLISHLFAIQFFFNLFWLLSDSHSLNSTSLCSLDHAIDNRIIDDTNDEVCCKSASECTECLDCDRIVITCDCVDDTDFFNPADNEDNDDPDNDSNQSSYDSFELQSLLKCDELDPKNRVPEETSPKLTLDLKRLNANKLNLKSSTEKLKTSPIDRPRSITPININSFEAYLNQPQAIDSNSSKCDKLTITLPGKTWAEMFLLLCQSDQLSISIQDHSPMAETDFHARVIRSSGKNFARRVWRVPIFLANERIVVFHNSTNRTV